ncbi:hypothetical protein N2152v2_002499 [Parachlorella kessleri]
MSRAELPAEVLAGCAGNIVRLWQRPGLHAATVSQASEVQHVAWNRNNKVVAAGCQDGSIHLCYSQGQAMSVLKGEGGASLGSLRSLDWSTGSKFLAAGSSNGGVHVWDLKVSKMHLPLPRQAGAVTSVRYHPDDKFLGVASESPSGAVALYDFQGSEVGSLQGPDKSAKYSLQAPTSEPLLACGSGVGGLLVWDWNTGQLKEHYEGQHKGAVRGVGFVVNNAGMVYSAGMDGKLVLRDRRSGPSSVSQTDVGVPLISLSVREDHAAIAVDGYVLLYDPRKPSAPQHRLECLAGSPVTGLHWQHCYANSVPRTRATTTVKPKVVPRTAQAPPPEKPAGVPIAAATAPAPAAAAAAASRIPVTVTTQATVGNPTYSTMRRQSGIGTGAAGPRQPSSEVAATSAATPALQQLNSQLDGASQPSQGTQPEAPSAQGQPGTQARAGASPRGKWTPHVSGQAAVTPAQQHLAGASELGGLGITPLSGMVPRRPTATATPGHVTPAQQLQARQVQVGAASTPLAEGAGVGPGGLSQAGVEATPPAQQQLPAAAAAAAVVDVAITPLSTMAARPSSGGVLAPGAATAGADAAAATPVGQGLLGTGGGLDITPLSTMRPSFAAARSQAAAGGPAVLLESTNQPQHRGALQQQLSSLRQQGQAILQRPPLAGQQVQHRSPAATGLGTTGQQAAMQQQDQQHHQPTLQLPSLAENLPSPKGVAQPVSSLGALTDGLKGRPAHPRAELQQEHQAPKAWQQDSAAPVAMVVEDSAAHPYADRLAGKQSLLKGQAAALPSGGIKVPPRPDAAADDAGEGWLVKASLGGCTMQTGGCAEEPTREAVSLDRASPEQLLPCNSSLSSLNSSPPSPAFSFQAAPAQHPPSWQERQQGSGEGAAGQQQQQRGTPDAHPSMGQHSSPSMLAAPSLQHAAGPAAGSEPFGGAVVVAGDHPGAQHGLREDILALHLDVLNQFQVQQEQMTALVQHVVDRQDSLAAEVKALRRQLQGLLQTRNDFLWL